MKEIREEIDKLELKSYYLENLSELLCDYFYYELNEPKYSKGETLVTVLSEKLNEFDNNLQEFVKKINDFGRSR